MAPQVLGEEMEEEVEVEDKEEGEDGDEELKVGKVDRAKMDDEK